jgi:hypothetical protein
VIPLRLVAISCTVCAAHLPILLYDLQIIEGHRPRLLVVEPDHYRYRVPSLLERPKTRYFDHVERSSLDSFIPEESTGSPCHRRPPRRRPTQFELTTNRCYSSSFHSNPFESTERERSVAPARTSNRRGHS